MFNKLEARVLSEYKRSRAAPSTFCTLIKHYFSFIKHYITVSFIFLGRSVKGRAVKKKARLFSQTSLPPQILYLETNLTMNCGKKEEANDIMWYYNGIAMRNP